MNNGTLVQYLVIERVICFNMLRLQELKQEQEFGICKYTRSRNLLSRSRNGVGVSKNKLRSPASEPKKYVPVRDVHKSKSSPEGVSMFQPDPES